MDLQYAPTVRTVMKRNSEFYQSIWKIYTVPVVSLYKKIIREQPEHKVSMGTFLNLRPFYIRNVSLKDMEMCVCMLHLHARWCVVAILKLASQLDISLPFIDYTSFLSLLYVNCGTIPDTYIPWECTPNKNEVCDDILPNFSAVMNPLSTADEKAKVSFTHFEQKVQYDENGKVFLNKKGKPAKRLAPVKEQANAKFLVEFMRNLLPDIIHHRNVLKLYRNIKATFLDVMGSVYMDIDFSGNLTIGIWKEPQSLYYSKKQVTVHSGIVKYI